MITITAFKWVPRFAQGQVRDFRVRWMLEELGLPYQVRLVDAPTMASPGYRAQQPFGQVPVLTDDDGTKVFETGAILLHLAQKHGKLIPADPAARVKTLSWLFAALNSVEPFVMQLILLDIFQKDEEVKRRARPGAVEWVEKRFGEVQTALGARDYLAGEFSIADMMMAGVVNILKHTDIPGKFPALDAYRARCLSRSAYQRALAAQIKDFEGHSAADMKWPQPVK